MIFLLIATTLWLTNNLSLENDKSTGFMILGAIELIFELIMFGVIVSKLLACHEQVSGQIAAITKKYDEQN